MNVDTYTDYGAAYGVTGFLTLMLFQDDDPWDNEDGTHDMAQAMKYAGVKDVAGPLAALAPAPPPQSPDMPIASFFAIGDWGYNDMMKGPEQRARCRSECVVETSCPSASSTSPTRWPRGKDILGKTEIPWYSRASSTRAMRWRPAPASRARATPTGRRSGGYFPPHRPRNLPSTDASPKPHRNRTRNAQTEPKPHRRAPSFPAPPTVVRRMSATSRPA